MRATPRSRAYQGQVQTNDSSPCFGGRNGHQKAQVVCYPCLARSHAGRANREEGTNEGSLGSKQWLKSWMIYSGKILAYRLRPS